MGALPHCIPILPVSLAGHPHYNQGHTTPQRRSWQKLIQPFTQKILNSIRNQYRKPPARHGRRGSPPPLPLSVHLATYSKMRFPTLRPPARRRNSTPSCWDRALRHRVQRSGAGTGRPSRTPFFPQHPEGGPCRGQPQPSRLWGRLRDHRPATASSPQRRGCRRGSARGPASPPPRPRRPPRPAAASGLGRPYLEGPPERVEGTVQQQGGPAVAEQPQQLPEQHPSWADGRGRGLRATWGGSRASRLQRRWLAPIPGARLSQL